MSVMGKQLGSRALDHSEVRYTGSGITGPYTLPRIGSENSFDVWISGAFQSPAAYSTSGTTLTFSETVDTGLSIIIKSRAGRLGTSVPGIGQVGTIEIGDGEFPVTALATGTAGNIVQYVGGNPTSIDPGSINDRADQTRIMVNAFRISENSGDTLYQMIDGISDDYGDDSGVDLGSSTNVLDGNGNFYTDGVLDFTLLSNTFVANTQPDEVYFALNYEDISTTAVLNTDVIVSVSRDAGVTWTAATLAVDGSYNSTQTILTALVDISAQPAGTDMKYRIQTFNSKAQDFWSAAFQWR